MAKRSSSSRQAQALETARERSNILDAERRAREQKVDELVARFVLLDAARQDKTEEIERLISELRAHHETIDIDQSELIRELINFGETETRMVELLDLTRSEVRRLKSIKARGHHGSDSEPA